VNRVRIGNLESALKSLVFPAIADELALHCMAWRFGLDVSSPQRDVAALADRPAHQLKAQDTAALGFAVDTTPDVARAFRERCDQLGKRSHLLVGAQNVLANDALSQFALAVGCSVLGFEAPWLLALIETCRLRGGGKWRASLLDAARLILGQPLRADAVPPVLRAALAQAKLVNSPDADPQQVLMALPSHERDPVQGIVALSALVWAGRASQIAPSPLVYIVAARTEDAVAEALHSRLVRARVTPWYPRIDVLPGDNWDEEIPKALQQVILVVVLVGQTQLDHYRSEDVARALDFARKKKTRVVPVLLDGATSDHLPYGLFRVREIEVQSTNLEPVVDNLQQLVRHGARSSAKRPQQ